MPAQRGAGGAVVRRVRSDTLPEGTKYRDFGCRGVVGCDIRLGGAGGLNCRLTVCKEDYPEAFYDAGRRARNEEIVGRWQRGEAIPAIAAAHRPSTRSIHRLGATARAAVASCVRNARPPPGAVSRTRSKKHALHVEICANGHPVFTGTQRLVDTAGRVEKFRRKYGKKATAK